jgi:hypothetical protein
MSRNTNLKQKHLKGDSMSINNKRSLQERFRSATLWVKALVLTFVGAIPVLSTSLAPVYAAPSILERELQHTTSVASASSVSLTWIFDTTDLGGATNVDHIEIEFCNTPLGTTGCDNNGTTGVNGADNTTIAQDNIPILPASPTATLSGPWTSTGNSASRVGGDSGGTSNQILIDKTTADNTNNANELQIAIGGFTNDEEYNVTYYTRMRLYSDAGTTLVWEGVFAQSTARQLTVNARVQERLDFCTGVTSVDDATTSIAGDCSTLTDNGNTVDIGVVDASQICVSGPSNPCDQDNGFNGVAMIRTNAFNGAVVDYFAEQNAGSGQLKVAGATCTDFFTTVTDQCFNAADGNNDYTNGAQQETFTAGTENFGMTIAGVNCGSTAAYTCTFASGSYNLVRDAEYDGDGANTFGTSQGYAWDARGGGTGTDRIASSAGSAVKVIEDEALIMKFAATAGVTTPTGQYTVTSTYIATATF